MLPLAAVLLMGAAQPVPQPETLDRAEAAKEGRALVDKLLSQRPSRKCYEYRRAENRR